MNEAGGMAKIKRYALWLLPDETAGAKYADLINTLSERYHTPRFSPHVTLLGRVTGSEDTLAQITRSLADKFCMLTLPAEGLAGETNYFRSLYVKLECSKRLLETHEQASTSFAGRPASDYLPHLSLVYGHLPETEKTKLGTEIEDKLPNDFQLDRLQLVYIAASVRDWRTVATCLLPV